MTKRLLVCGGAGFIGSQYIKNLLKNKYKVFNLDLLTYAASLKNLSEFNKNKNYIFQKGDIGDQKKITSILKRFKPDFIVNFAAETHVDRSIDDPKQFIKTNILGVYNLLNSSLEYWHKIKKEKKNFKFIQISTDEVYGSIKKGKSKEISNITPNSPYSASKASADHLIFSYFKTFNFPSVILRPSNNYGPYQFPEKLIPLIIINALEEKKLPVYGSGKNIRNWLYVNDCVSAIQKIILKGKIGHFYNIGGPEEVTNIQLVRMICKKLDEIVPRKNKKKYESLITFVKDRPGHDFRYSLNSNKIFNEIKWKPKVRLRNGIESTIKWYLENNNWWQPIRKFKYKGERLGK
jgi:dTDP-glucose 4,6-dehydratase